MTPELRRALAEVASVAGRAREPWWVIGSAAMALHGAEIEIGDIDLLMSRVDAAGLLQSRGVGGAPGSASEQFRSDVFGRFLCGGFTVEVFGGFHVRDGAGWRELVPVSRVSVASSVCAIFVPSIAELISMCGLFGRPKDAERGELLRGLI